MSRPIVTINNVSTGEVVEREMNDEEYAQYEKDKASALARYEEEQAKIAAKAALLAQLGITEEQAKLLLS